MTMEIPPKTSKDSSSMTKTEEISFVELEAANIEEQKQLDKIYRKLDKRIIPALWTLYFLTSFGSNTYGVTLTMNREEGHSLIQKLNLSALNLSTANALGYIGTILFDLPMNLVMTKVSPQTWLARIAITVGLIYACFCALKNYQGLYAVQFIGGVVGAGVWPGMSYYITLWYPNHRMTQRVGYYFTAAQISCAVSGLVSAGFQKMDGVRGYTGWQWLYLIYGCITMVAGFSLLWWLPDRPFKKHKEDAGVLRTFLRKYFTPTHPLSTPEREVHCKDMIGRQKKLNWGWKDIVLIITDSRLWPIVIMYFGVVGTGFGLAVFGSTIISVQNPHLSDIDVSLLYAPIWVFDLFGIVTITPFADRFKKFRFLFFSGACVIIIVGMIVTTFAEKPWSKYGGLLIAGYGLGPTVPICMSWAAEIFEGRYGDVGASCASALVTGLGNLGSVTATYALYSGWADDVNRMYLGSNMVLVGMLGVSIFASFVAKYSQNRIRQA
ncbi:hypothetical protein FDK38_005084 [Candidozyma auris]|nr:hypothetical protein FDK38_005084 [[Candida] auris]